MIPLLPSISSTTTSDLSMAWIHLRAENFSIPGSILPLLLKPAVSISVYFLSLYSSSVSIGSLVVPAMSDAITFQHWLMRLLVKISLHLVYQ